MKFVALDVETTGVHKELDILTAAFVIFDLEGSHFKELEVKILPPNGIFSVDPKALKVNKIDLAQHLLEAEPLETCQNKIKQFLHQNSQIPNPEFDNFFLALPYTKPSVPSYLTERLVPVGSQVHGDIAWIKDKLFPNLGKYVSHKIQETCCLAEFLKLSGKLNIEKTGLESLANHFGVEYTPHNALEDCRASARVFIHLLKLNRRE